MPQDLVNQITSYTFAQLGMSLYNKNYYKKYLSSLIW